MKVIQKSLAKGFTVGRKELNSAIRILEKEFFCQNHVQDPVNFIADGLDLKGYIDHSYIPKSSKYSLLNRYLVMNDGIAIIHDSYEKYNKKPNPRYLYGDCMYLDMDDCSA